MSDYAKALDAYLKNERQTDLADAAEITQAAISRYARGKRFPPRDIAERIDRATSGQVPVALWIADATKRFGIAA